MNSLNMLLSKIVTVKDNCDYRLGDVIFKKGFKWEESLENVLNNPIYNNTILKKYLEIVQKQQFKIDILYEICETYKYIYEIPNEKTLVIHVRAGDVCVHKWFMTKNYIDLIKKYVDKDNSVENIVFVITFSYGEYKERNLWLYSEEKQKQNINTFTNILNACIKEFPNLIFDIYSNENIDKDLIYCIFSTHFIGDVGGFSDLINILRLYKNNIL